MDTKNTKTKMLGIAALAVAFMVPLFAGLATANTTSDQGGDDFCGDAVDPSGAASPAPTATSTNWCDANSANTAVTSVGGSAVLLSISCQDNPAGSGTAADTVCHGGGRSKADTSFGAGNFGGDYPVASKVVFTNAGAAARFTFTMDYVDTTTGVLASTALSATLCILNAGTFTFGVTGLAATADQFAPAGKTIDQVYAYRTHVTAGGLGCGNGDGNQRELDFAWTYEAVASPSNIAVSQTGLTNLNCNSWTASATNSGTAYGESQVSLYHVAGGVYDNIVLGWFDDPSGAASGADASASALGSGVYPTVGDTYQLVATSWGIGESYNGGSITNDSGLVLC